MQIELSAVTGKNTSGGAPVLFEAALPAGTSGVYSTGGKVYFYGPKTAITPTSVGFSDDLKSMIAEAVRLAVIAAK